MTDLSEEELQEVYSWIDEVPLTRQKKNMTRDFCDGVLTAEVVHHFLPKYVELHNYSPANAIQQKVSNWRTLNRKVFSRLNFAVPDSLLQGAATGKQGVIEFILSTLRSKIELCMQLRAAKSFSSDDLFLPPQLDIYHPDQLASAYQFSPPSPSPLGRERHIGPAAASMPDSADMMSRTYPTAKNPLLPSRIPLTSKRKELYQQQQQDFSSPRRQDTKLPPIGDPRLTNQYGKLAPPPNSKRRENSAKYKLRLAEKDQRILETQEYIQFLQMKVTRYEHLVHIKDMKIEALKKELETAQLKGTRQPIHHTSYQRR